MAGRAHCRLTILQMRHCRTRLGLKKDAEDVALWRNESVGLDWTGLDWTGRLVVAIRSETKRALKKVTSAFDHATL